jgi:hypothetical protein
MSVFSCDLVEESRKHVRFLQELYTYGVLLAPVSAKSLDRYLNQWLSLVAREIAYDPEAQLVPPPDVAWLWHCHRLAPMNYERHVRSQYGGVLLEACPSFSFQREDSPEEIAFLTRDAWYAAFPYEPFFLQDKDKDEFEPPARFIDNCRDLEAFDLITSTKNQSTFLWQVSGPKFSNQDFLHQAVENYHKFLKLSSVGEKALPLVPTYQIDLMWHTHILASLRGYQVDCLAIRGVKFDHDDSLNDRAPGASLDVAFRATEKLWKEAYGQEFVVAGGMYRGEPPPVYYNVNAWHWQLSPSDESSKGLEHTITVAAGPSSTGKSQPKVWLIPQSHPFDPRLDDEGRRVFIPANARSRVRNVNSNEAKTGYIFGCGSAGAGYYSMETRDAYILLDERLSKQAAYAQQQVQIYECGACICWGSAPSMKQEEERGVLIAKVKEINDMRQYVKLRCESKGPDAEITFNNRRYRSSDGAVGGSSDGAAVGINPFVFYAGGDLCGAGGCGGGGGAAGGCG